MKKILQFFVVTLCIFVCGGVSHSAMPTEWAGTFDGVDDYVIKSALNPNLNGTSATSICATFTPASSTGNEYIVSIPKTSSSHNGLDIRRNGTTLYAYVVTSDSAVEGSVASALVYGEKSTACVTYDGTTAKTYVNGILGDTDALTGGLSLDSNELNIGRFGSYGAYFEGEIENVRIYNRALSATEVSNLYDGENITLGLVMNYPLSEGAGTIIYDAAGEKQSAEHSVNTGNADTTDWIDDDSDGTPNGMAPFSSTFTFSIGTGNGFEGNYLIAENVSGGRFYGSNTIDGGVWADVRVKASGSGVLQIYNASTKYETIGTLTSSVQTFTHRIKTYGGGKVIFKNLLTTNIDEISIKEVLPPAHGTLTNADTTSPGEVGSFWQEAPAGGNNFKNGYSDGLLTKTDGTTYAVSPTAYGEWEFDIYNGVTDNAPRIYFASSTNDILGDRYSIQYTDESTNDAKLRLIRDGSILFQTANDYAPINTWYRLKVVRNSTTNEFVTGAVGTFAMYIKGGTFGTEEWTLVNTTGGSGTNPVTDNTYTSGKYVVSELDIGDQIANLKINGKSVPLHDFTEGTGTFDEIFIPAQGRLDALLGEKGHASRARQWESPTEWVGDFDGTNDDINLGDIWKESSPYVEVKFICTGKADEYRWLVNRRSASGDHRDNEFIIGADNKLAFYLFFDDGSSADIVSDSTISLNTEYHVKAWYDQDNERLHLVENGVEKTKDITDKTLTNDAIAVFIGSAQPWITSYRFLGQIWDVKLGRWNSSTEEEEIDYIYKFSEGAGGLAFDSGDIYGTELVANGSFDTDTDWTKGTGWTIGGGKASCDGTQASTSDIGQSSVFLQNGATTMISFEVKNYVTGTLTMRVNASNLLTINSNGIYAVDYSVINLPGSNYVLFRADADFIGSVDHVSVKEIESPAHGTIENADTTSPGESGSFWQARADGETPNRDKGYSSGIVAQTDGTHYFPSTQAYGTWEVDLYKGGDSHTIVSYFIADTTNNFQGPQGGYLVYLGSGENVFLTKTSGDGNLTNLAISAASYVDNNTWYRLKVVRNSTTDEFVTGAVGTFAVYIKGGSFGDDYVLVDTTGGGGTNPVTDNTYTTSSYIVLDPDAGDSIANVKVGTASLSAHDFIPGTGTANKLFVPARVGSRVLDALGWELETVPQEYFRTLSQLTAIQEAASAFSGARYWIPAMRQFFVGQGDGTVLSPSETSEELTTAARTALDTGNSATEGVNYWDKEVKQFFRGLADGSLEDFMTWFGLQ